MREQSLGLNCSRGDLAHEERLVKDKGIRVLEQGQVPRDPGRSGTKKG